MSNEDLEKKTTKFRSPYLPNPNFICIFFVFCCFFYSFIFNFSSSKEQTICFFPVWLTNDIIFLYQDVSIFELSSPSLIYVMAKKVKPKEGGKYTKNIE